LRITCAGFSARAPLARQRGDHLTKSLTTSRKRSCWKPSV
jgi:hypothetical protein